MAGSRRPGEFAVYPLPRPNTLRGKGGGAALENQSCILQTHTARLGARTVPVEESIPQLDPQEYAQRLRDIGHDLYDVFIQYENNAAGP